MSPKKHLLLILALAASFRLLWLTKSPPALNWDEVSIGYNAYSILKTGRDEWGKFLPLSFKAYGEHKLPGMIYASIPAVAIFGASDLGVRITPAVIGIITVLAFYVLLRDLISPRLGFFGALLLAVSPWHVHFTRASYEASLALLFLILSVWQYHLSRSKPSKLLASAAFATFSMYTYNAARIVAPLLYLVFFYLDRKYLRKQPKIFFLSLFLSAILLLPSIVVSSKENAFVRWEALSIMKNEGFIQAIGESRRYTPLPDPLPRLIHNKYTHLAHRIFLDYLKTFSTEFLFFKGSGNTQRSVQGMGLLYLFEIPLLALGILRLSKPKYRTLQRILVPWLLIGAVPSAITVESPSALRAVLMLPPLLSTSALGLEHADRLARQAKNKLIPFLSLLFGVWNILYFAYRLWGVYPIKYSSDWQFGYKEAISEIMKYESAAEGVYLTSDYGEPYMYLLFYGKVDPRRYQDHANVDRTTDPLGWVHVLRFDKYHFVDFEGTEVAKSIVRDNSNDILLVTGFAQMPGNYPRKFEIKTPSWQVMFEGSLVSPDLFKDD